MLILSLGILYYIAGCFAFCWAVTVGEHDDSIDGDTIAIAVSIGWIGLPVTLIIIGLLKVFR